MTIPEQAVEAAAAWARQNAHRHTTPSWEGDYIDWHEIAKGMIEAALPLMGVQQTAWQTALAVVEEIEQDWRNHVQDAKAADNAKYILAALRERTLPAQSGSPVMRREDGTYGRHAWEVALDERREDVAQALATADVRSQQANDQYRRSIDQWLAGNCEGEKPAPPKDRLSFMVDAVLSLPHTGQQEGWQPIDTAPKDMRPFLAFVRASRKPIQEDPDSWHIVFRKRADVFVLQDDDHTIIEPTHWKPLDEPLVAEKREQK